MAAPDALNAAASAAGSAKPCGVDRLDAAGLEEALGKGGARGEIGGRAEIGEEDFWPRAGALELVVRFVAQRLERRGQPHRRQRIEFEFGLAIGRQHHRLRIEHRDLGLVQVRKFAGAGQHVASLGDVGLAHGPGCGDLALDQVLFERGEDAAGLFDLLEQRPRGFAKLPGQRFDAAGAGGGIGHLGEVGFFQQHQLRVARGAPGERIGQSQRQRMRQHGDGVGAAEAGGEGRHRRAQHVHVRVALRQHPPGGIGRDEQRFGRRGRRPVRSAPTTAAARGISPASGTGRRRRQSRA